MVNPSLICDLVQPYVPTRENLRSADKFLLEEHRARNSWGERSFLVAAAKIWNGLPHYIRTAVTTDTFKSALKNTSVQHPQIIIALTSIMTITFF